ncbi:MULTISPECIES: hydroxymethylglutaryl-CoA lyase [Chitinophagaceae]
MNQPIHLTECPRDAQQGLPFVIASEKRAEYINTLLKIGFDVIDFGSFVSPKAVPQMADSAKVLELIDKENSTTKLLAIVGNARGGIEAAQQKKVDILGFPYSISNTFLEKNINSNSEKVLQTTQELGIVAKDYNKSLRVYISMAFGNPYGDEWSEDIAADAVQTLVNAGVHTITLSDTTGLGTPESISALMRRLLPTFPDTEFGLHLHTKPNDWKEKIEAGWDAGCRHFDGVINGFGGCPMTGYELLGNINTLNLLAFVKEKHIDSTVDVERVLDIATRYPDFKVLL